MCARERRGVASRVSFHGFSLAWKSNRFHVVVVGGSFVHRNFRSSLSLSFVIVGNFTIESSLQKARREKERERGEKTADFLVGTFIITRHRRKYAITCHNPAARRKYRIKQDSRERQGEEEEEEESERPTQEPPYATGRELAYATKVESKPRLVSCLRSTAPSIICYYIRRELHPYARLPCTHHRVRLMNEHRAPMNFYATTPASVAAIASFRDPSLQVFDSSTRDTLRSIFL